ncbi:hypothetical protein NQ318_016400 [Aromia moschata]|uniref:RNA polymerase II-associated protein 3 n=1 Tax=Aromia moschata TaxID=1265417 RepID=A0AAV8Z3Y7_9CUCU|nr:hypothetical protein NQ318_016400 [Aromia moschata]
MNPVLLQKQLRDNASDVQDFCKDLKEWGESMKRKEESLKKSEGEKTVPSSKVRKIHKMEKKAVKNEATLKTVKTKKGATNYAAWEKFDADAECNKLEGDIDDDSELTDECNEKQDEALIEKEKGNKFVHSRNWDAAIKCYTKAIEYYAFDPVFYANRALCYLKKGQYQDAERDCTLSLKLDGTYVKAYQRRAAAKEALKRFEETEYDILRALELEPKNKECIESLKRIRILLGKAEKPNEQRPVSKFTASRNKTTPPDTSISSTLTSKATTQLIETKRDIDTESDIIPVKPIKKPPHVRSQKPLKRIEIIEINAKTEEKSDNVIPVEPQAIKEHVFETKLADEVLKERPKVISNFKKKKWKKRLKIVKTHQLYLDLANKARVLKVTTLSKEVKNTSNIIISNGENRKSAQQDTEQHFTVPKTAIQFYLTWKNFKSTEDKYKYLKMIEPRDIPKIFLGSIESNILSNILEVLAKHYIENKDTVFDILKYLTHVKRFGATTMFMTPSDKNNLWKLFDYIKETEQQSKEDVGRLIQKYEL